MAKLDTTALQGLIKERFGKQEDFCAEFGVTRGGTRRWILSGQCPDEQMDKLCEFFEVPRHRLDPDMRSVDSTLLLEAMKLADRHLGDLAAPDETRTMLTTIAYKQLASGEKDLNADQLELVRIAHELCRATEAGTNPSLRAVQ